MKRAPAGFFACLLLALAFAWASAGVSHAADRVISPSGTIQLFLRQGKIIEVDQPLYSVFVADPEIADVMLQSPQSVYVFGKAIGDTTVFLADETGKVVVGRNIQVTHNVDVINGTLESMYPGGDVVVRSVGRSLIVEGSLRSPQDAEDIRRVVATFVGSDAEVLLRTGITASNQIHLRVRVTEMARALEERIGVDWDSLFGGGSVEVGLSGGPVGGATGAFDALLSIATKGVDFELIIDALQSEGLVTVLAEPNLTAISGESASFLAGGEFPVPIAQEGDTVTIEYKQFGVSLVFTPTLIGEDRISLKVAPEVSELDFSAGVQAAGVAVPALRVRRASTTVELASGQSFAIAGLLQSTSSQDVDKLPILGDLPIIGALFRSSAFLQGESELVIVVTPYVVEPAASPAEFQIPIAGYAPPNELERILRGEFQSPAAPNPEAFPAPVKLFGAAGFMLD